jgi:DNA-binding response OmpR family regulator
MAFVLVIDDEPLVRKTVRRMLERSGHLVVEACDGREGERIFAAQPIDLVITDVLMPEQEGIETIRNLRRTDPSVRILAMSGGGRTKNQEFLELARKLGATATIAKPFDLAELTRTVDRLCCSTNAPTGSCSGGTHGARAAD